MTGVGLAIYPLTRGRKLVVILPPTDRTPKGHVRLRRYRPQKKHWDDIETMPAGNIRECSLGDIDLIAEVASGWSNCDLGIDHTTDRVSPATFPLAVKS